MNLAEMLFMNGYQQGLKAAAKTKKQKGRTAIKYEYRSTRKSVALYFLLLLSFRFLYFILLYISNLNLDEQHILCKQ